MIRIINLISFILGTIASIMALNLGRNWLDIGYGLNPWIAFPVAAIAEIMALYGLFMLVRSFLLKERHVWLVLDEQAGHVYALSSATKHAEVIETLAWKALRAVVDDRRATGRHC